MNSYWDLIVPDVFFMIVLDGDLSADDVESLRCACKRLNSLCHSRGEVLYKRLLWKFYEEVSLDRHHWRFVKRRNVKLGIYKPNLKGIEWYYPCVGLRDFTTDIHVKANGRVTGWKQFDIKAKKIAATSWNSIHLISETNQLLRITEVNFADVSSKVILSNVRDAVAHYSSGLCWSTVALDLQGRIWVQGSNMRGQLGCPGLNIDAFQMLPNHVGVQQIAMSDEHLAFIDAAGRLWTCGDGTEGTLGYKLEDPAEIQTTPKLVEGFEGVKRVSVEGVMVFLDSSGKVWMSGSFHYEPQVEDFTPRLIFEKEGIVDVQTCAGVIAILDNEGCIWQGRSVDFGNIITFEKIPDLKDVTKFKLYEDRICFLT